MDNLPKAAYFTNLNYRFVLLLLLFSSVCRAEPAVNIVADKKVPLGQTISVDIVMNDFPESQGGGLNLTFNPKVVRINQVVVDQSVWRFFQQDGQVDNDNGKVTDIVFATFPGVSGDGIIAKVELTTIKKGNSRLRLEESSKNPFSSNGVSIPVSLGEANLHVK